MSIEKVIYIARAKAMGGRVGSAISVSFALRVEIFRCRPFG